MTTQELKDVLGFGAQLAKLADALKGGLNLSELPLFIGVAEKVGGLISEAKVAGNEYLTLDDAGRAEIDQYITANWTLNEKKPQDIVQSVLKLVVDFSKLLQDGEAVAAAVRE